jgi:hypothetical protein
MRLLPCGTQPVRPFLKVPSDLTGFPSGPRGCQAWLLARPRSKRPARMGSLASGRLARGIGAYLALQIALQVTAEPARPTAAAAHTCTSQPALRCVQRRAWLTGLARTLLPLVLLVCGCDGA